MELHLYAKSGLCALPIVNTCSALNCVTLGKSVINCMSKGIMCSSCLFHPAPYYVRQPQIKEDFSSPCSCEKIPLPVESF